MEEQDYYSPTETNLLHIVLNITGSMLQIYVGQACYDIMWMISLYFMRHQTDANQIAIYGVVWLMIYLIAFPFCFGITQSLNNQTSAAMGQSQLTLSQLYLNFTIWTIIVVFIPLFSLIIYNANFILAFFIPSDILMEEQYARNIMINLLCAAFFFMEIECLKLYLMACQIFKPFPYIYVVALIFHFILCSILFQVYPNYYSVSIALLSSQVYYIIKKVFIFVIIVGYICLNSEAYSMFKGFQFSCQIFKHKLAFKQYIKVSLYLIFHQYADLIGFYSLSLIGFQLGVNETSVMLAFSNTFLILYRFPLSLSIALMLYIGNSLSIYLLNQGQNKIQQAKIFMKSGLGMYSIILPLKILLLVIFRQQWVNIYTSDPVIQNIMLQTLPYLALSFLFDSIQAPMSGILKGVNKQEIPFHQTVIAYYIIGLPLILILVVYYNLNLIGIWLGFSFTNIYLVIVYMILIFLLDWEVQVKEIQARLNLPENQLDKHQYQLLEED